MAQQRKILYIITQTELGGAQHYVITLASSLKTANFNVVVAGGQSVSKDTSMLITLNALGIRTIQLKHLVRNISPIRDILAFFEIYRLCKRERPEIAHLNSSKVSILAPLAARLAKVKIIFHTVHGFAFDEEIPGWKKKLYLAAERMTAKFKDNIIFLSEKDKKNAERLKIRPKEKSAVIHNGVNITEGFLSRENARKALGIPKDGQLVGVIANFYSTKGLRCLIDAIEIAKMKIPEILCVIIGDGDIRQPLEAAIRAKNLEGNILLLGRKKNAKQYIRAFDAYANSSEKEGLPFSILDAMAAGVPIAATSVGAVPEALNNENSVLVSPKDPRALAAAIIKILTDSVFSERIVRNARSRVRNEFSQDTMVKKTISMYEEAIASDFAKESTTP